MSDRNGPEGTEGLSSQEAASRLAAEGPNALPEAPPPSLWRRFLTQFKSPLIYILLVALGIDLFIWAAEGRRGAPAESIAIAAILLLNASLGVWQEWRAENALKELRRLATPQAWVVRDGHLQAVPSTDLVPGDILHLEDGQRIPADGTVVSGQGLLADESVLTGESEPVDKPVGDEVSAGTLLARGSGYARITRTGPRSAMGRLATMLAGITAEATPLEKRLERFGNAVARVVLVAGAALIAVGVLLEGIERLPQVALLAIALAVAAVPEGLPAILAVTLALGVERMARKKAIVRRLQSVEALGSVTVIATDKTGTLTENKMTVQHLEAADRPRALQAMVLANEAEPGSPMGDPLEVALLAYAGEQGLDAAAERRGHERKSSRPFDAKWSFMRATVEEDGRPVSYLKGAPERLLERSTLSDVEKDAWRKKVEEHAAQGLRAIALAWGEGEREEGLTFVGLALLLDPPRPEVPDAIRTAQEAGIRVIMITGDHPTTARAISRSVGIRADRVLTGDQVDNPSSAPAGHALGDVDVFARAKPEHKLLLVEDLQGKGEIVAMTGDGVNDAAALKRANVGVAMGQRGSDVAREVADIVLQDDNFATIVDAVEEGRSIYENIQKCIRYLFAGNAAEVLVVILGFAVAYLSGLRDAEGHVLLPLTAVQLLWINLITDSAPALALVLDRNRDVMRQAPRQASAPLLDKRSIAFIAVGGVALAILSVATMAILPAFGLSDEQAQTTGFLLLISGHLLYPLSARRLSGEASTNVILLAAIGGAMLLQVAAISFAPLRAALDLVEIPLWAMGWAAAGGLAAWGVTDTAVRVLRRSAS